MGADFGNLIGPVARRLLGEPNTRLSSREELRFGSRGSIAVRITGERAGTWYDFEATEGGGVLDLLRRELRLVNGEALDWLRREIGADIHRIHPAPHSSASCRPSLGRIVATYDYRSPSGELLFQVTRHDPKDFRQRRPDGRGGWIWGVRGIEPLPYRLPELLATSRSEPVFIPEGEKDVERLRALGLVATCNPGGAGRWRASFATWLRGRDVILLPDNDDAGRTHMRSVAAQLAGAAARIRVLELPGLPGKGDVSDWLAASGTRQHLLSLAEAASTPVFESAIGPTPINGTEPGRKEPPALDATGVELTEDGVALVFAERNREKLRYCHDSGCWYAWSGTHWQPNRDGLAFTRIRELVRSLNRTASLKAKAVTGKAAFTGAVERFAQRDRVFAVTAAVWDQDPWLLGTPGGVVDLRSGALRGCARINPFLHQGFCDKPP